MGLHCRDIFRVLVIAALHGSLVERRDFVGGDSSSAVARTKRAARAVLQGVVSHPF